MSSSGHEELTIRSQSEENLAVPSEGAQRGALVVLLSLLLRIMCQESLVDKPKALSGVDMVVSGAVACHVNCAVLLRVHFLPSQVTVLKLMMP